MSIDSAPAVVVGGSWVAFWLELPMLVLAVAVIIVATTAMRRARPQDVPKVFAAFAAAFGWRPRKLQTRRRPGRQIRATEEES